MKSRFLKKSEEDYKINLCKPQEEWPNEIKRCLNLLNEKLFQIDCKASTIKKLNRTPQKNFSLRFKNYIGLTPKKYIIYHRIELGKQLLQKEELKSISISEIAFFVGYDRLQSFTMAFKSRESKSPTEWRKENLSN